jgi:hypothetical protein
MQTSEVAQHWRSLLNVSFRSAFNYKVFVVCTTALQKVRNSLVSLSTMTLRVTYNFRCQRTDNHAMKTQVVCGSNAPCIPQASAICGVEWSPSYSAHCSPLTTPSHITVYTDWVTEIPEVTGTVMTTQCHQSLVLCMNLP